MRKEKAPWLLVAALALGCGDNQVTGKIFFEGKPVTLGTVILLGPDGAQRSALIAPDGSYQIRGVVPGQTKFAVISVNPSAPPLDPEFDAQEKAKFKSIGQERPPPEDASKWFPLPASYADLQTSDLKGELQRGTTQLDLHLKKS